MKKLLTALSIILTSILAVLYILVYKKPVENRVSKKIKSLRKTLDKSDARILLLKNKVKKLSTTQKKLEKAITLNIKELSK